MKNHSPSHLSDTELAVEMKRLAGCERETTAALISHLAEFDARRLYLGAGFSSLFTYCTEVLRLSEHEAYNRIVAARVGHRFPLVRDMLCEGSLKPHERAAAGAAPDRGQPQSSSCRGIWQEQARCRGVDRPALPATRPSLLGPQTSGREGDRDTSPSRSPSRARVGMRSGSRPVRRRARSYGGRRTCSGTEFPMATSPRSSIER
jgi:hypothetical protein